jgi:hypothetical protein
MEVKSAQAGEGGGCTLTPFTMSTITYKVVVCAPAEQAGTPPLFLLYRFMYSVLSELIVKVKTTFEHRHHSHL